MSTSASRSEAIGAFNAQLARVKELPPTELRSTFPDFAAMDRAAVQQAAQHCAAAEARNRAAVERSHVPATVAEYRGAGSVRLTHPAKNQATHPSQLSVPIVEKAPQCTSAASEGKRLGKKTSDVCLAEVDSVITGRGSLFASTNCKTYKGWTPGAF